MIAALFDADGTLYSAQFGWGLMKYARAHGRRALFAVYYLSLVPNLLLRQLRLIDAEAFDRPKIARLAWLLRGWDAPEAARAFEWVTNDYLLSTRRQHVLDRLKEHQAKGNFVLIVSGTFAASLELLGKKLGVADLIGTRLEVKDGHYTGRVIPPVIKGADKLALTRKYISDRKLEIDWPASFAYGDSYSDLDLLGLVGHPIAVHPDDKLRALAQSRNWEILEVSA